MALSASTVAVTLISDTVPVSSMKFLDIQAGCRFTVNAYVTYSQISHPLLNLHSYLVSYSQNLNSLHVSINNFFNKCDPICVFLRISSHLRNKSLIKNFIFAQFVVTINKLGSQISLKRTVT